MDLLDPTGSATPPWWGSAVRDAELHSVLDWPVMRALASTRRGPVLVGALRDGDKVAGLVTLRLRRLPALGLAVADVESMIIGAFSGIALAGGLPGTLHPSGGPAPSLFAAAVRTLEASLRQRYGKRLQAVMYRHIYRRELPHLLHGVSLVRAGAPALLLRNTFPDYDSYLRTLRKSRRVDQQRLVRNIDADPSLTVAFGPAADAGLDATALHRLCADTARRNHTHRWPPMRVWPQALFETVLQQPDVLALRYTGPDGLVAATLTFDHPVAPILGPWGALPLGGPRRSGLWFDHLARLIRWGIEQQRPLIVGGKGAQGPKEALGFTPEPQWTVLRRLTP
ncbi:hypothetical protein AB0J72_35815 [Dactylosporangium sp. NPDC049742]|uniref:hypothetical protein n=1 Tax=Dactylosporangium sp. NPDC049742 TaxID=3154737 RepID=UPI00344A58F8